MSQLPISIPPVTISQVLVLADRKKEKGEAADYQALLNYLDALPEQQLIEVMALMCYGRGDFKDFASALSHAEKEIGAGSAGYIAEKNRLADYIRTAMLLPPVHPDHEESAAIELL